MLKAFLVLLLFHASDSKAIEPLSQFQKAMAALSSDSTQGYSLLEQISPESSDFLPTLEELQKIHYKNKEWNRFFSYAIFYRNNYLNDQGASKKEENFRPKMLSLEILALGKQCQWDEAFRVANFAIQYGKTHSISKDKMKEIHHAFSLLQIQHVYPKVTDAKIGSEVSGSIFKETQAWPIHSSRVLPKIKHPKVLRLQLENLCPSN